MLWLTNVYTGTLALQAVASHAQGEESSASTPACALTAFKPAHWDPDSIDIIQTNESTLCLT